MATNILGIGQSALTAAQVGLATTGHNIANAATPGYNRQVVIQGAAMAQNFGAGFMGQGTEVASVMRVYNEYLGQQVQGNQTSKSSLDSYYAQIRQLDNLLADPATGLGPTLQDFFGGIQEVASNPTSIPARQAALSSGEALAARFNSLGSRMAEIEQGVNTQVLESVSIINTYAQQIAALNDAIGKAQRASGQPPNDLLDQRDQLVLDLNKEIKATVVKQGDGDYNVFIGNGQALVVGATVSRLSNLTSPTNPEKIEVAYTNKDGELVMIGASSLAGGKLGGLLQFRDSTLTPAQNALGRVAIGLANTFNTQHQAGFDLAGVAGGAFFTAGAPIARASTNNLSAASMGATISDVNALTTSDYSVRYDGTNYIVTRLSDSTATTVAGFPQTIDGITLTLSGGPPQNGDNFLIRPTVAGAVDFDVALTDPSKIAAAAQTGAPGDSGNALLLGALQTAKTLGGSSMTFQSAYSQYVSQIGNKTRELEVTSSAAAKLLTEAKSALENESGVNLDEEAANLLRYQQAYQAAAKVMQIAKEMFDMLLTIGR